MKTNKNSNTNYNINYIENCNGSINYNLNEVTRNSLNIYETDNYSKSKSKSSCNKEFICPEENCDKKYTSKSRLFIHFRTHTGEKPFNCDYCNKSFNEKGNLKIHLRIHTGEKPYACKYKDCNKSFKAYGHLSDHIKRHYNIRPYVCEICSRTFSRKNTLKTHYLTHTGEKPFLCVYPRCNKRFSEKGNMKTHLKTHYKNILSQSIADSNETVVNTQTVHSVNDFIINEKSNNLNEFRLSLKRLDYNCVIKNRLESNLIENSPPRISSSFNLNFDDFIEIVNKAENSLEDQNLFSWLRN